MPRDRWIRRGAVALGLSLVMLLAVPVSAVAPGHYQVWGVARKGGTRVPDGTVITAWIGATQFGQTTSLTSGGLGVGSYGLEVLGDDPDTPLSKEGGVAGEVVTFRIDGLPAAETGSWDTGWDIIDLNAAGTPTETPTPSPTSTDTLVPTPTETLTPTPTETLVPTETVTPTITLTPSSTLTPTATLTPSSSATTTQTPTDTTTPEPTATHTPTATSTSTPDPSWSCDSVLVNGGFETEGGWVIPDTRYTAGYSGDIVRTGNRAMRMGIAQVDVQVYSYSDARQAVTIPADATKARLVGYLYALSGEPLAMPLSSPPVAADALTQLAAADDSDVQYVVVLNRHGYLWSALLWQREDERGWRRHEFDLRPYAGHEISIQAGVYNNGIEGVTAMYMDDMSLEVCVPSGARVFLPLIVKAPDGAVATPTPTPTETPTPTLTPTPTTAPTATGEPYPRPAAASAFGVRQSRR